MPSGLMPPTTTADPAPDVSPYPRQRDTSPGIVPGGQVTVTVAMTLTGEDALSAADEVKDGLWHLASELPAGATVLNVATAVSPARGEFPAPGDLGFTAALPPMPPLTFPPAGSVQARSGVVTAPEEPSREPAPLRIYPAARIATLDDTPVRLTRREYDLLLHLAQHPGRVFTRQQLSLAVWQEGFMRGERTIDVHVHRLRLKLGDRGPGITTVRGVGYRLDAAERVHLVAE